MKIYKTQEEVDADIKDERLIIDDNVTFECDVIVKGYIKARNIDALNINALNINAMDISARNITAMDINTWDINAWNINTWDINAMDVNVGDINARSIDARDINARSINARDICYHAFCIAYKSIECNSWEARRSNHLDPVCLDGELTIREKEVEEVTMQQVCDKFGREVKIKK